VGACDEFTSTAGCAPNDGGPAVLPPKLNEANAAGSEVEAGGLSAELGFAAAAEEAGVARAPVDVFEQVSINSRLRTELAGGQRYCLRS